MIRQDKPEVFVKNQYCSICRIVDILTQVAHRNAECIKTGAPKPCDHIGQKHAVSRTRKRRLSQHRQNRIRYRGKQNGKIGEKRSPDIVDLTFRFILPNPENGNRKHCHCDKYQKHIMYHSSQAVCWIIAHSSADPHKGMLIGYKENQIDDDKNTKNNRICAK